MAEIDIGVVESTTTQPDYRRSYNATDDWGRSWLVCVETKTGDLTGIPIAAGWSDPINTPPKYLYMDRNDPKRIVVDYEGWALELEAAWKEWQTRYEELGYERFGEKFNPGEKPAPYLQRLIGPPPLDPSIPRAAAAGSTGFLGVIPKPRPEDQMASLQREVAELKQQLIIVGSEAEQEPEEEQEE